MKKFVAIVLSVMMACSAFVGVSAFAYDSNVQSIKTTEEVTTEKEIDYVTEVPGPIKNLYPSYDFNLCKLGEVGEYTVYYNIAYNLIYDPYDFRIENYVFRMNGKQTPNSLGLYFVEGSKVYSLNDLTMYENFDMDALYNLIKKNSKVKYSFSMVFDSIGIVKTPVEMTEKYPTYKLTLVELGNVGNYKLYYNLPYAVTNMCYDVRIGDYVFTSTAQQYPYDLGLFIVGNGKAYTLIDAYKELSIDMDRIVDLIKADTSRDYVFKVQRYEDTLAKYSVHIVNDVKTKFSNSATELKENDSYYTVITANNPATVHGMTVACILSDGTIIEPKYVSDSSVSISIPKVTGDVYISVYVDYNDDITTGGSGYGMVVRDLQNCTTDYKDDSKYNGLKMNLGSYMHTETFTPNEGYAITGIRGIGTSYDSVSRVKNGETEKGHSYTQTDVLKYKDSITENKDGSWTVKFLSSSSVYLQVVTKSIYNKPIKAKSVTINKKNLDLNIYSSEKLTATIAPNNTSYKAISWKSSDEKIATVSRTGVVTAKNIGTATITATARDGSDIFATCKVTVKDIPTAITKSMTINRGSKNIVKKLPINVNEKTYKYSSNNSKIVSVNGKGYITAKSKGIATITVKDKDSYIIAKIKVTVKQLVTTVKLNRKSVTLQLKKDKNKTVTLKASVTKNANNKSLKWKISNSKIATVTQNGKVVAKKTGTCFVTVTSKDGSNKFAKCKIIVK